MTCAADILTALDGTKPADASGTEAFLQLMATNVSQAVVTYVLASVTTSSVYSGAVIGTGAGAFTVLSVTLMSTLFEAGLKSTTDVNNKIAEGFAKGLHAMLSAGTVTEAASGTTTAVPPVPISFSGVGSAHTAIVPAHAFCSAALARMTTEQGSEQDKLKLMANSFAKIVDDFIPTISIITAGAGAVGAGAAIASVPAVDPTFPA